jgi:hypothetical protein
MFRTIQKNKVRGIFDDNDFYARSVDQMLLE